METNLNYWKLRSRSWYLAVKDRCCKLRFLILLQQVLQGHLLCTCLGKMLGTQLQSQGSRLSTLRFSWHRVACTSLRGQGAVSRLGVIQKRVREHSIWLEGCVTICQMNMEFGWRWFSHKRNCRGMAKRWRVNLNQFLLITELLIHTDRKYLEEIFKLTG